MLDAIAPDKDVDGFHLANVGRSPLGAEAMVPCTPLGCLMLLRDRLGDLAGREAVVVGRSNIVGKPMAQLLLREHCTVTVAHSRTRDLPAVCRRADILVAAVGRPEMVGGDWIKPGATVSTSASTASRRGDGKPRLVGDVDFAAAAEVAGAITPVPGGVGPMTIACLLANTLTACCRIRPARARGAGGLIFRRRDLLWEVGNSVDAFRRDGYGLRNHHRHAREVHARHEVKDHSRSQLAPLAIHDRQRVSLAPIRRIPNADRVARAVAQGEAMTGEVLGVQPMQVGDATPGRMASNRRSSDERQAASIACISAVGLPTEPLRNSGATYRATTPGSRSSMRLP